MSKRRTINQITFILILLFFLHHIRKNLLSSVSINAAVPVLARRGGRATNEAGHPRLQVHERLLENEVRDKGQPIGNEDGEDTQLHPCTNSEPMGGNERDAPVAESVAELLGLGCHIVRQEHGVN